MKSHAPEVIANRVLRSMQATGQRTRPVALGAIDAHKVFLPASYTQLYYTPVWADLDCRHQLRYSQLYALRTNEVIMLFERYLVRAVLPPLARRLHALRLPRLHRLLLEMLREEQEHDRVFVALNHASRPDLYAKTDFFFFPPTLEMRAFITLMGHTAPWLAHPLWLLFFIEESSLAMARELAALESRQPQRVDPNWLAVHREHTRDERRHTLIDRLLFESVYAERGGFARGLDGWLFEHTLKAILYPRDRGAGVRVADQLIRDCPELAELRPAILREIVRLGGNSTFLASLFSQRLAPRAWKLFHRCPELDRLADWVPDYA